MIEQFIKQAASEIGIEQSQASSAIGGILALVKDKTDSNDFSSLLSAIPGAEAVLGNSDSATSGSVTSDSATGGIGGLLGGLASKAFGNSGIGQAFGGAGAIASLLSSVDINAGQLSDLAGKFFSFAKEQAGEDLVAKILENAPEEIRKFVA